jgi:N,N'-diacetyllegionaminate synthase
MIIAEIAQAHEGSLGIAHSYIDALADVGVDAVKFQTHIAEAESSDHENFRVKFSYEDATRFDYWKRMEFTPLQWLGLKEHCDKRKVEFISSPFSVAAVNLLEDIGVNRFKIGSGEMTNYLMLDRIIKTKKPIILSSGMSNWDELKSTINYVKPNGNPLSLLQCTTAYPTPPEDWGLTMIPKMKSEFQIPIGFSDHSSNPAACLAATALGAEILEFHVVFDKQMFGPDSKASLTIEEVKSLVQNVKMIKVSLNSDYEKNDTTKFDELKVLFGKSLCINKNLIAGHIIKLDDLESKKPGNMGVKAIDFEKTIGKTLVKSMKQWEFLKLENLK